MKFDNVVANPPFSLDKWGADEAEGDIYNRFWRGLPPKSKGDYAFISHMIEAAVAKKGRVAVVAPHGVLFRGAAEGRIRRKLIEDNLLDAVIGLPGNLFPTTNIPVAILIFDCSREKGGVNEARKEVFFIDASNEYQSGKNQNTLGDAHIHRIIQVYNEFRDSLINDQWSIINEKFAHVAGFEEIKENDFNLNIPRYVDTFEEEEEIDIQAVQREIEQLEAELAEVRGKMDRLLKDMVV
ncbi:N-6 DNA methylase [Nitrosococcus oceani ATCC 19707]|uniref:site-specific DNA-methyltransferase (adenine-specific) n=3 Tax=Nitrosococcus oceani TaxID=1229 RepID=Q3JBY3_NITOC|nr:N-6 DNA methylase [Nitrosococcus oceani ATCC 19707]KFI19951.1 N-6 DNA methylase [Nitrosococcus oceani C-27]GEM19305.1 N-6 DNA methylase [Nitrosococcus oceani]